MKYIDTGKLIAEIKRFSATEYGDNTFGDDVANGALDYVLEEIIPSLQQEQPKVDYNKFEKLFEDFCERNKGHHITAHDACMWFWELGLNARKEETK